MKEFLYPLHRLWLLTVIFLPAVFACINLSAQEMKTITGIGEREQIELTEPHSVWFTEEYDSYEVNNKALNSCFQGKKLENYYITIVMGTWCPDSRREVPRFYKILDNLVFPPINVRLIFVDMNKKEPSGSLKNMKISYVPTFIIRDRKDQELGRIVEAPKKSLEKDLCDILFGK